MWCLSPSKSCRCLGPSDISLRMEFATAIIKQYSTVKSLERKLGTKLVLCAEEAKIVS